MVKRSTGQGRGKGNGKRKADAKARPPARAGVKATAKAKSTPSGGRPAPRARDGASAAIARLERRLAAAQRRIARLEAQVETDGLTGAFNRRGFERQLARTLAHLRRYGGSAALLYIDVDQLKPINDRYGHATGDAVLKAIAAVLVGQVRGSDVIGRLGGDEFGVLLWNISGRDAKAKARAIEKAVRTARIAAAGGACVGISVGATLLRESDDPTVALARADSAMYARKSSVRKMSARRMQARAAPVRKRTRVIARSLRRTRH